MVLLWHFHTLGPKSLLEAAGIKEFLPWDLIVLYLIGHLFYALSPLWGNFQRSSSYHFSSFQIHGIKLPELGYFYWRKGRTLSWLEKTCLYVFHSIFLAMCLILGKKPKLDGHDSYITINIMWKCFWKKSNDGCNLCKLHHTWLNNKTFETDVLFKKF